MGTMVLRSQDCPQNPIPADSFRPPPPPRSRQHRTGHRPRQTMLPAKTVHASLGSRGAPTPTNPLPRRNNRSGCPGLTLLPCRRCRTPEQHHRRMMVRRPAKELVMEGVTVLRRGQEAAVEDRQPVVPEGSAGDLELCSTRRLGPDPAKLPKQTRLMDQKPYLYAGSGFLITSPPPSSLPLPTSFLAKKVAADAADLATIALRCLLRLDLP